MDLDSFCRQIEIESEVSLNMTKNGKKAARNSGPSIKTLLENGATVRKIRKGQVMTGSVPFLVNELNLPLWRASIKGVNIKSEYAALNIKKLRRVQAPNNANSILQLRFNDK